MSLWEEVGGCWCAALMLGSCEILFPVGTVTLDSPHQGFDPALPQECDPGGGRRVHKSLEIVGLRLLLLSDTL